MCNEWMKTNQFINSSYLIIWIKQWMFISFSHGARLTDVLSGYNHMLYILSIGGTSDGCWHLPGFSWDARTVSGSYIQRISQVQDQYSYNIRLHICCENTLYHMYITPTNIYIHIISYNNSIVYHGLTPVFCEIFLRKFFSFYSEYIKYI